MCGIPYSGSMLAAAIPLWGMRFLLLMTIVGLAIWGTLRWYRATMPVIGQSRLPFAVFPVDPVEVLRERYARGEITLETFEEMLERVEPRSSGPHGSAL